MKRFVIIVLMLMQKYVTIVIGGIHMLNRGGSFKGRTTGFDPVNRGSIPCPPTIYCPGVYNIIKEIEKLRSNRIETNLKRFFLLL